MKETRREAAQHRSLHDAYDRACRPYLSPLEARTWSPPRHCGQFERDLDAYREEIIQANRLAQAGIGKLPATARKRLVDARKKAARHALD